MIDITLQSAGPDGWIVRPASDAGREFLKDHVTLGKPNEILPGAANVGYSGYTQITRAAAAAGLTVLES